MNQTSCGDDRDNARPQRQFVIDEDDIGTAAFRENAAIWKTCGPGGRRRYQVPGFSKPQQAVGGKAERGQQLRWIIIVGRKNRAKTLGDDVRRLIPAAMPSSAATTWPPGSHRNSP